MSAPRRLLDDPAASTRAKDLLRSLEHPAPMSPAARAALGVRVATSAAALPAAAKLAGFKLAGSIAAIVAGGAAVTTLAVTPLEESEAPKLEAPPKTLVAQAPPIREPRAEPPAQAAPPVAEAPSKAAPGPARAARPDPLAQEEALLENARRATRSSPAQALALLREHEKRFPNGQLTAERYYLSARAHEAAGNFAQARASAERLAARFPNSTYLRRLSSLLGDPPAGRVGTP